MRSEENERLIPARIAERMVQGYAKWLNGTWKWRVVVGDLARQSGCGDREAGAKSVTINCGVETKPAELVKLVVASIVL
jgi:hypothetical protein